MAKESFFADRFICNDKITFTSFWDKDDPTFNIYLLELPWKNNKRRVSCIPCATYIVERDFYHKGGYEAFEYRDVPDRDEIKIHKGNWLKDILGCQATGMDYSKNDSMVRQSKIAFNKFMDYMEGIDIFTVEIRNV